MIEACCVCGNQELREVVVSKRQGEDELFSYCSVCEVRIRIAEAPKNIEYPKSNSELNFDLFLRHRLLRYYNDEFILNLFCGRNLIVVDRPGVRVHYADFSKDALPKKASDENWWQVSMVDNLRYKTEQPVDNQYDTVLLLDVLERTKNPIALVDFAKSLLKENGRILIETGNADLLNLNGWYFCHADHVLGLTMKSLNLAATKCGLVVTTSFYVKNKMWLSSSRLKKLCIYLLRMSKNFSLIVKVVKLLLKIDLQMLADPYTRDHIFVVLEKRYDSAS